MVLLAVAGVSAGVLTSGGGIHFLLFGKFYSEV